jgi:CRISPR system Cascade subunit CasB
VPEIWELTIGAVPEKLAGRSDTPSNAEQAAHAAMTLYALHQQSKATPMHQPGVSFGQAVSVLRVSGGPSAEAVTKRFLAVSTAQSIDEVLIHIRGLIGQLKAHGVGLDYAALADDLSRLLTTGQQPRVRLKWGRDFYRSTDKASNTATTSQGDAA